jgi:Domain of unknown function (DUF4150)
MPLTININGLTLAHKGSTGTAAATLPDACKTPSPGGPVPLPYPNIAMSADLAKGTTTIKVDGGNMAANKGSEISRSSGDEAGTAGGVTSSTFIKEATWMLYSFDVMLEGKNACRLTDKQFMNHQNTVCLGGWMQKYQKAHKRASDADACKALREYIEEQVGEGRTGEGPLTDARGLEERMHQNTVGGSLGVVGAPNFPAPVFSDIATRQVRTGKNDWQTHDDAIKNLQENIKKNLKEYEEDCHAQGHGRRDSKKFMEKTKEAADKPRPTPADWTGPQWQP